MEPIMEIVEKSMGNGIVQSPHIFKRASTYFFHDFPINKKDKLGTRWTKKLSIYAGYTLRTSRERPIALCLLSGRPRVQLPSGTPGKLENNGAIAHQKNSIFGKQLHRFGENTSFDVAANRDQILWGSRVGYVSHILLNDRSFI